MVPIHFFCEDIEFELNNQYAVVDWLLLVVSEHGKKVGEFSFIFCSDDFLLRMNQEILHHDYFTDIITFPLHVDDACELVSEMFISVDRVIENSNHFGISFEDEMHRVMVHGVLHLLGYDDKTEKMKFRMHMEENKWLDCREWLDFQN